MTDESQVRRMTMERLARFHDRITEILANWRTLTAAEDGALAVRVIRALLVEVTASLDDAYRRRVARQLSALEEEHWVPTLECVRNELRKASSSLSVLPGARLEHAVEQLRRSMGKVSG